MRTPQIRLRVVWGLLLTMATFSPTRALVRVDLPTLGRPQRVSIPQRFTATSAGAGAAGSRGASRSGFSWSRVTPRASRMASSRVRIWAF